MGRSISNPLTMVGMAANVLVAGAIVAALYVAQDVFIPLTLSTMLAFLLAPLADRLEHWGLRRIPAVLVLALVAFSTIGGFLWIVGREATKLAGDIPKYQTEIVRKIENFSSLGEGTSERLTQFVTAISEALRGHKPNPSSATRSTEPDDELAAIKESGTTNSQPDSPGPLGSAENPIHTAPNTNESSPMGTALGAAGAVLSPLTNVGLVIVFTIFMLLSRDDLRDRLIRVLSGGRYILTTKAIDEASRRISGYILAQTIVNSLYGFCIGLGLWLIGLTLGHGTSFPNYALWGLMCTVLRFVPYVGPILAGAFPVALSLIVFPGFEVFAATALLFTAIELLSNNVIEPWLYGSSTGMSPMAVIVAAVFWTWMWGPVGLLLSIPLTSSLIVMGKYVPQLGPLSVLLGDRTPLPADVSYYQRLLADDAARAEKLLQTAIDETNLETAADDVLLPTIRRIRRDRAGGELSAARELKLMQSINGMIDNRRVTRAGEYPNIAEEFEFDSDSDGPNQEHVTVLGCTAHHESEELMLKILSYCVAQDDINMRWAGTKALPSDIESWVRAQQPAVVVIAIMPLGGMIQAKYLCKQLHQCSPTTQIVVTYYGKPRSYDSSLMKFRAAGATFFATSLSQARTQIGNALRRQSRKRVV